MRFILLLALAWALPAPAAASAGATACRWPSAPAVITDEPRLAIRVWEAPDSLVFDLYPQALPELSAFRAWARSETDLTGATVDTDAYALLRRQLALYRRLRFDVADSIEMIVGGRVGRIRPMSCLEQLLFADHQARFPVQGYTEFNAFVLKKDGRLRAYSMSSGTNDGVAPSVDLIRARLDADRAQGWTVELNLHNHPFNFKNPTGDIGATLVPSGSLAGGDVSALTRQFTSLGLAAAAITNGFDTVHFTPAEIARIAATR
ncbi:MAG: hypothetical protein SF051_05595 [Elusimicrobiota bacterium]|nr:hypothetical protein [Elusimicrobiota bacterium]